MFDLPVAWLAAVLAGAAVLLAVAVAVAITAVNAASTPDKLRISQR
jgi:predicted RecA/RadA family phage recombinase